MRRSFGPPPNELRANSELKSSEYSVPVLGLIFLRYADVKFTNAKKEIESKASRRRTPGKVDYFARGVLFLPEAARFSYLLDLPEGKDIGKEINEAMGLIEEENPELKGVLPKTYQKVGNDSLATLLKTFNSIPLDVEGDAFGKHLLEVFESHLSAIFRFKKALQKKAENLRQTRDLLLPKLVSGEVDVSELEIETRGAAA